MGKLVSLNKNWKFHLGDIPDADYMGFNDGAQFIVCKADGETVAWQEASGESSECSVKVKNSSL